MEASLFGWENLLNPQVLSTLAQDWFNGHERLGDVAKFMECPGPHEEVYDIDYDDCTTDPEELRKGMDAFLILVGVMTEDEYVTNLHMDVWWNGVYMRREDHKMNDEIEE